MKHVLLTLFLVALWSMPALVQAQTSIRFGLMGGLSVGDIREPELETTPRYGLISTLFVVVDSHDFPIAFETGLTYSQQGTRSNTQILSPTELSLARVDYELDLDYLRIPMMARFKTRPWRMFRPYVTAGGYIGFLQQAEATFLVNGIGEKENVRNATSDRDNGLLLGMGTEVLRERISLHVRVEYARGFGSISDQNIITNEQLSLVLGISM